MEAGRSIGVKRDILLTQTFILFSYTFNRASLTSPKKRLVSLEPRGRSRFWAISENPYFGGWLLLFINSGAW